MIQKWDCADSKLVLSNPWARVRKDSCRLPNGLVIDDYYYWEGGDFSQVFALTSHNEVVLVRQYKHAVREIVLELPAGLVNSSDSDPLAAGIRELREETGFVSSDWQPLGTLNVSSAKATTRAHAFLARNAKRTGKPQTDPTEEIEVLACGIPELLRRISDREICDSNTLAACLLALRKIGQL